MSRTVRALAVVLAVLFLASPVVAATPSAGSGASWWGSAWDWIVELLLPEEEAPTQGLGGGDAGGTIDPDGMKVLGVTSKPKANSGPTMR